MAEYKKGAGGKRCENSAIDEEEENGDFVEMETFDGDQSQNDDDSCPIINSSHVPSGRPFSAVTNLGILNQYFEQPAELFDEFGFRKSDSENEGADPTVEPPPIETTQQKMKWLAHIQFAHERVEEDLTWGKVKAEEVKGGKFDELLRDGIPHSSRRFLWPRLCGAKDKWSMSAGCGYMEIVKRSERDGPNTVHVQIEKDLLRTLPSHYCFLRLESLGTKALRRVLRAIAFMYPDLGYCQGMGIVAASLLLVCSEENVFWMMAALIENVLPANFYTHSLLGLRADEKILRHLMQIHMPELSDLITRCESEMTLISVNWLLTLLASCLETRTLFRVWDNLFARGSVALFQAIISMLKTNEEALLEKSQQRAMTSADLFAEINQIPSTIKCADNFMEVMQSYEYSITAHLIEELRKKYQAKLMDESGIIASSTDRSARSPRTTQPTAKRKIAKPSKNPWTHFFELSSLRAADDCLADSDPKTKNIRQTELLIDLHNAIIQVCQHFELCTESHDERVITTQADYSAETHAKDRERFFKTRSEARKRARALLDFEKQTEDELGFTKNAIITVLDHQRDEHCWVGELDGRRGWFPAKFVEVIDERGKNYCSSGDEAVDSSIASLVRGPLAMVFRRVLFHGIRSAPRIGSSFVPHAWAFIESVSKLLVERHSPMTNSKMTLCYTFKLDEDKKVLSPEQLLLRAICSINASHNAVGGQIDMKLRSLLVYGLNEQCLHLWFETLCGNTASGIAALRRKYYHSWSFIRSPVSQQIQCELRLLSQLSFTLNVDSEIDASDGAVLANRLLNLKAALERRNSIGGRAMRSGKAPALNAAAARQPLKEGVRDILISHHLFSYEL